MRGILLFITVSSMVPVTRAQDFSAKDFLSASAFSQKKFEHYLSKNRFSPAGRTFRNDTIVNIYNWKKGKKKGDTNPVKRNIETYQTKSGFSFAFLTSSKHEYDECKKLLYKYGFFCGNDNDSMETILFQKKNISVQATKMEKEDTLYTLQFYQAAFPTWDMIQHADDLLQFYSHEYLAGFFGEKNVIRDVYYFSDKEIVRCSVLFPRTSRQAVFLWEDELNFCKLSAIILGGNTRTGNSVNYDGVISENIWSTKDGIHSGMSLHSLVKLNGNTFYFYGKTSPSPYMVLPDITGALDFKKNKVVLGCLNPYGSGELDKPLVEADKVLPGDLGLYVFMIMILPGK